MSLFTISQQGRSTIQTGPEFVAPKKAAGDEPRPVTLTYTNWRGETAARSIIPTRVWWGSTPWHHEPQWLLTAVDAEKGLERDFALKDFGQSAALEPSPAPAAGVRNILAEIDHVVTSIGADDRKTADWMIVRVREALALLEGEKA